jgi:hypothetical protein
MVNKLSYPRDNEMRIMAEKKSLRKKMGFVLMISILILMVGITIYGTFDVMNNMGDYNHPIRDVKIGRYTIFDEPVYKNGEIYWQMKDSTGVIRHYATLQGKWFPTWLHKGDLVDLTRDGVVLISL